MAALALSLIMSAQVSIMTPSFFGFQIAYAGQPDGQIDSIQIQWSTKF